MNAPAEGGRAPEPPPSQQQPGAGSPIISEAAYALLQSQNIFSDKEAAAVMRQQLLTAPYSFHTNTSLTDSQVLRCLVTGASESLPSIPFLSPALRALELSGNQLSSGSPFPLSPPDPVPVKQEPPDEELEEEEIDVCNVSPDPPPKRLRLSLQTPIQVAPLSTNAPASPSAQQKISIRPRSQRKRPPQVLSSTPRPRPRLETSSPPLFKAKNGPVSPLATPQKLDSPAVPLTQPPAAGVVAEDWSFRVLLLPQEKTSKNLDYVGGVKDNVNAEYFVFCRDQYAVPFRIFMGAACKAAGALLRVKVTSVTSDSHKEKEKPVLRCPNHRELFRSKTPVEQFLLAATDDTVPLSPSIGSGFDMFPIPETVEIVFYCRNSCDIKHNKRLLLCFAICDKNDQQIAKDEMELKVCQVPLRDIVKMGVRFNVLPGAAGAFRLVPVPQYDARSSLTSVKQEVKEEVGDIVNPPQQQPMNSSVRVIYVNGHEAYARVMAAAKAEEDRVRLQPEMNLIVPYMNAWTRDTPIEELLLVTCGMIDSRALGEIFKNNGLATLGALSVQFDVQLGRLQLPPDVASRIATVFLNWYNTLIFNELNAAARAVA